MDVLILIDHARAAGLTVSADGDRLIVEGPSSAAPLVRALGRHKADVLAALKTGDRGDGDTTPTNFEEYEGSVTVTAAESPPGALTQICNHGMDLVQEPSGRVHLDGPSEAVVALPNELLEAMDRNWEEIKQAAIPEQSTDALEDTDCPPPCGRCGSLELWFPILGGARCLNCDPPARALRTLEHAERVRRTHGLSSPAGAAEFANVLRRTIAGRCGPKRLEPAATPR